jgi:hypothetical protein
LTDQDVIDLYRCLLGRAPEAPDTIAAFRHYYPDFDAGRKAILTSDEFAEYSAQVTGLAAARDALAAPLALKLLMHASGSRVPQGGDAALRTGFGLQVGRLGQARLALVVGDDDDTAALDDLAPLGGGGAAVLHLPAIPRRLSATAMHDGTVLLTGPWTSEVLAALLAAWGERLDALFLLGSPAGPGPLESLLPLLSARALVVVRDAAPESTGMCDMLAALAARNPPLGREPPLRWRGLTLHHRGAWLLPVIYTPREYALPDKAAFPPVALAAIVRNEAVCVINMLRSALPFASFFAVLDTGSEDGTPELVQAFLQSSAVPHAFAQVSHERFADHFATMRNAALDMVPDWVAWVLMLDADEEMAPEDAALLLHLVADATDPAYALPRYNYTGAEKSGEVKPYPDRQVRLLRHGRGTRPRYSGAVHETVRDAPIGLVPLDASAIGGTAGGPHIHHLVRRFRDAAAEDSKQAFYRQIAARHLGE